MGLKKGDPVDFKPLKDGQDMNIMDFILEDGSVFRAITTVFSVYVHDFGPNGQPIYAFKSQTVFVPVKDPNYSKYLMLGHE